MKPKFAIERKYVTAASGKTYDPKSPQGKAIRASGGETKES